MKNNVIFLGCTQKYGYQFSAANTKVEFLAKGLTAHGDECLIHNGVIGTPLVGRKESKYLEGIGAVITYRKKGNQLVSWLFNLPELVKDLRLCRKKGRCNCIVLESPDYHIFLIYVLLARLLKYKILVISHEWGPTISSIHPLRKPSTYLFSATFGYFVDGILPISEFIINKIRHFNRPYIKIPVVAEYDIVKRSGNSVGGEYFLYCVYAAYKRVILQIIDAYVKYNVNGDSGIKLVLVLSGSEEQIAVIKNHIKEIGCEACIIIKTKVPFKELLELYANALALIVPLDPDNMQDTARFSQKIAEYLSSGRPIISNNVGEIRHYFTDRENIILCDYSVTGFVNAFMWTASHQAEAARIGISGFNLGKREFDYRELGDRLHKFILTL